MAYDSEMAYRVFGGEEKMQVLRLRLSIKLRQASLRMTPFTRDQHTTLLDSLRLP